MSRLLRKRILMSSKNSLPDIVIDSDVTYSAPIICNNLTITSTGILRALQMESIIIRAQGTVTIDGIIDADGKGWISTSEAEAATEGLNYLNGTNTWITGRGYGAGSTGPYVGSANRERRVGGGAPSITKPMAYRTILGLANAIGGDIQRTYGRGYDGVLGGGGGAGDDGAPGYGGGSGSGGGGGTTGNGYYADPNGGNGSQADQALNLSLFKEDNIDEIALFGGAGGGWSVSGGYGGGNVQIYANIVTISSSGKITARGLNGVKSGNQGMGGGGGGNIMIRANVLNHSSSSLDVSGGTGGTGSTVPSYITAGNGGPGLILLDVYYTNSGSETLQ